MITFEELMESDTGIRGIRLKYFKDTEKFYLTEHDNRISISLIVVKEKKSGIGTKIMNDIITYADKVQKIIVLTPDDTFGSSITTLKKFYKKFGFVENKGKHKDYEISESMYKLPK